MENKYRTSRDEIERIIAQLDSGAGEGIPALIVTNQITLANQLIAHGYKLFSTPTAGKFNAVNFVLLRGDDNE
jgi:hypothetical protein